MGWMTRLGTNVGYLLSILRCPNTCLRGLRVRFPSLLIHVPRLLLFLLPLPLLLVPSIPPASSTVLTHGTPLATSETPDTEMRFGDRERCGGAGRGVGRRGDRRRLHFGVYAGDDFRCLLRF
ncbi:hypothetical protein FA13DRAFT_1165888 [Coprinellus micaceus]|uniref:Uncharacterized protein n=1 Tax=Coprinellus micaceus TaxID=71717 RepID=A0A4Y7SU29_COPMI|nr:hypothetical protein FA13DRAFT_1165888 [Coprinellus micaceus]